jgi:RNA polymerase sigma-70 factor (ECF subfamily)
VITAVQSEQDLLTLAREGNQNAFRELVNRYQEQVAATVIGMLGPGLEAEDVGQEVFIRFYKSLERFRGDSALGTYLTRIAINLCLTTLQKRKRARIFSFFSGREEGPELQVADTGLNQDQRDSQALVHEALQQLEPDFRAVVVLRMLEGYSTKETAQMLDIPTGTVLSRLARGQKKLREILNRLGISG